MATNKNNNKSVNGNSISRKVTIVDEAIFAHVGEGAVTVVEDNFRAVTWKYWADDLKGKKVVYWESEFEGKINPITKKTFEPELELAINPANEIILKKTYPEAPFGLKCDIIVLSSNNGAISDMILQNTATPISFNNKLWWNYLLGGLTKSDLKREGGFDALYDSYPPILKITTIAQDLDNFDPFHNSENSYEDHAFEADMPFSKKELEKISHSRAALFYDVESNYEIFIRNYQYAISGGNIHENLLPSLQIIYAQNINEEKIQDYDDHISLKGQLGIPKIYLKGNYRYLKKKPFNSKTESIYKYFNSYGKNIQKIVNNPNPAKKKAIENLRDKFRNLVTSPYYLNNLNDSAEFKSVFPFYSDISFKTSKEAAFIDLLKRTGLEETFFEKVFKKSKYLKKNFFQFSEDQYILEFFAQDTASEFKNFDKGAVSSEALLSEKKVFDVASFYKELVDATKNKVFDFDLKFSEGVLLRMEESLMKKNSSQFLQSLMIIIFSGKMKKLIQAKERSFAQVMAGEKAYSETVLYRIEKYDGNGTLLQTFYVPNSEELDVVNYIDTQLKYAKEYIYKIFAQQLVIGTKYWYDFPHPEILLKSGVASNQQEAFSMSGTPLYLASLGGMPPIVSGKATISVFREPSIKLIESPYFVFMTQVIDHPPVFPDVNIIPYKDVNDRLLINMNNNTGVYELEPIVINDWEKTQLTNWKKAQNPTLSDEELKNVKVIYKNESENINFFEIYRTSKKPRSYKDFAGKTLKRIETACLSNSASFVDETIKPNRKYYYTFRVFDVNGHWSNPSPIYEVEIVDDSGAVYLLINVVELDTSVKRSASKKARRYIQIIPTTMQTEIDAPQLIGAPMDGGQTWIYKSAKEIKNLELGLRLQSRKSTDPKIENPTDSIWGKSFKIRLISKKTGRKIDLNIDFKHKFHPYEKTLPPSDPC